MRYEAVTFDLDDTLVTLERSRSAILEESVRAANAPPLTRQRYLDAHQQKHASQTRLPIFEYLLEEADGDREIATALTEQYRQRIGDAMVPVEAIEAMLDELASEYKIAIVTNGPVDAQRDKIERLGWEDRFDAIVISGRVGTAKPDTEPFAVVCDRLGVDASATVHVGNDPTADVEGALAAGLDAVLVVDAETETEHDVPVVSRQSMRTDLPPLLRSGLASKTSAG